MTKAFSGIRARLLALILAASVPALGIVAYLGYRVAEDFSAQQRERLWTVARQHASNITMLLSTAEGLLMALAATEVVRERNVAGCGRLLSQLAEAYPVYSSFVVVDSDGSPACGAGPLDAGLRFDDRAYFQMALRGRQFAVGSFVMGRVSGEPILPLADPILDSQGEVELVLVSGLKLDWLRQQFGTLPVTTGEAVSIVDRTGRILVRWPDGEIAQGEALGGDDLRRFVLSLPSGAQRSITTADGHLHTVAAVAADGGAAPDLYVVVEVPVEELTAPYHYRLATALAVLLVLAASVLVLAWYGGGAAIARPIARLNQAAEALRRSRPGVRVGPRYARNELGALGRAFDEMADTIEEREARLTGILDHITDAIVTIDEAGTIESANRRTTEILGYEPKELIGRNVKMLMPDPYRSAHDGYLMRYLETGEPRILGQGPRHFKAQRQDGSIVPISLVVNDMRLGDRRLFIGAMRDITQRLSTEAQLLQAQKMDAIGQLTGGIAHDFNNLLTVIYGNLEFLDRALDENDRRKRWVDLASHAARRGAELTSRLLAFSRRQVLAPMLLDVNRLVSDMDRMMRHTLGESIRIETVLGAGLWPVEVDPAQLENALLNLALNGRDAMPQGGVLTIETYNARLDDDYTRRNAGVTPGRYAVVAVTDSGRGMSEDEIEHAVEPFYTTKEVGEGSGLGLSMVYGFIKQSQGHVKVYSEVDVGTTIKMYLPRAGSGARAPELPAADARDSRPRGDETILIVEDDEDVRATGVAILEELGYRVLEAASGPEALELVRTQRDIDLLFVDIVMPGGMKGPEVAAKIRESLPGIRVLFTSGYAEDAAVANEGLDDRAAWIGKPYRDTDLAQTVRKVFNREL